MKKSKQIIIPILNDEYKVIFCFGNSEQIKKILYQWGHKPTDLALDINNRRGICCHTNGCHPVIAMPQIPKKPSEIGTLAHEAIHAIGHIFRMIEQDSAEEVYAHSVAAIIRKVLNDTNHDK